MRNKKGQFTKGFIPHNKGQVKECSKGICARCGEEFINKRPYITRKYCTRSCVGKVTGFQQGQKSWNEGKNKEELEKHYINGWKGLFEEGNEAPTKGTKYSEERIKSMSGENSPRWQGGKTPYTKRLRGTKKFKDWRMSIFKRDDYTCQKCNERGGTLHPHHIKSFTVYPELRFDVNNGSTLCVDCHRLFHKTYGQISHGNYYQEYITITI